MDDQLILLADWQANVLTALLFLGIFKAIEILWALSKLRIRRLPRGFEIYYSVKEK